MLPSVVDNSFFNIAKQLETNHGKIVIDFDTPLTVKERRTLTSQIVKVNLDERNVMLVDPISGRDPK